MMTTEENLVKGSLSADAKDRALGFTAVSDPRYWNTQSLESPETETFLSDTRHDI